MRDAIERDDDATADIAVRVSSRLSRILHLSPPENIFPRKTQCVYRREGCKGSSEDSCNLHNLLSTRGGITLTSSAKNEEAEKGRDEKSLVHRITFFHTSGARRISYTHGSFFLQTHPTWQIARYLRTLAMHELGENL